MRYLLFCLVLILWGCQSTVDKASREHAERVLMWKELSRYAGNELKLLDLTISGSVLTAETGLHSYKLSNIKLISPDKSDIDLLAPEFVTKFACDDECTAINLYQQNEEIPGSLLSEFFEQEEGRFFRFYGQLVKLNSKIKLYKETEPMKFKAYLNWLSREYPSQDSLAEFYRFLDEQLTDDKWVTFLTEQSQSMTILIEKRGDGIAKANPTIALPLKHTDESLLASNTESFVPEPAKLWSSNPSSPSDGWTFDGNNPRTDWLPEDMKLEDASYTKDEDIQSAEENNIPKLLSAWLVAKQQQIEKGDVVCSYLDSYFGIVEQVNKNEIKVEILGSAKTVVDGVKRTPAPGYLFSEIKSFVYMREGGIQVFELNDIARCNIDVKGDG